MGERIGAPISPVEAIMPKNFVREYIKAIIRVIPPDILALAQQIVEAHRPLGVAKNCGPVAMARILFVDDDSILAAVYKIKGATL